MKLLNYTSTYFSVMLLGLLSIWAVVFYYAMFNEIYDSIDDGLEHRKMVLIARANEDLSLLDKPQYDEYLFTIKQVDHNGDFEYSETVEVQFLSSKTQLLNQSTCAYIARSNSLLIHFATPASCDMYRVHLYDMSGTLVYSGAAAQITETAFEAPLNKSITSGIYVARYACEGYQSFVAKLFIQ